MITTEQAREALENMDDYARMANIEPIGPYAVLKEFIEQYNDLVKVKKVCYLLEPKDK